VIHWRTIPGFSRYEASDDGRIRRRRTGYLLSLRHRDNGGYVDLMVYDNVGVRRKRKLHNLVLETFVGPRPTPRHHGAHTPDNDLTNNRLSNLAWKLPEENEADKKMCGTAPKGGRTWRPSRERVRRVKARVAAGESYSAVARDEGMHRHSVSRIVRGLRRARAA